MVPNSLAFDVDHQAMAIHKIANPKNGTTNKAAGRLEGATRAADSWSAQMSRSPGRLSAWAIFKGENLKFP